MSVSSDGATVVVQEPNRSEMRTLSLLGDHPVRAIGPGSNAEISPDGKCLAYERKQQVYVRRLDENAPAELVSPDGGLQPTWGPDGSELFYVSLTGGLVRAPARTQPTCKIGAPQPFINGPYLWSIPSFGGVRFYHIAPDGQRFLLLKPVSEQAPTPRSIVVVQNWFQEWRPAQ
jgi:hypothetical protein